MVTRREPTLPHPASAPGSSHPRHPAVVAEGHAAPLVPSGRLVAVGPGPIPRRLDAAIMLSLTPGETAVFPIQTAKIERPPLQEETLSRDRLLDWLAAKIHHRAVLVVAEAGYGKTTLLADFCRRTRIRTIWYRLDEQDRDPVAFMNYLVATGRQVVPEFAPTTAALLRELGSGGVSHDTLVAAFVRELAALGSEGTALIIDDYHLVDDVPEVRSIVQAMLREAPERLSVVIASRRTPRLAIARLRSHGEVVGLTTEDLRFRTEETEQLFRERYGRPLEPDVLEELSRRTEGWAASLQLVRTALRDRSPGEVRAFIRGLSGTQEQLYDYLAEEVVGDLDPELQQFLMRTSILRVVEPELARVATRFDEGTVRRSIEAAERIGLLGRRGESRWSHRYHPLVQEFLVDRLTRSVGRPAVLELHRTVARHAEDRDWRLAVHHWAAAGDGPDVHRVLSAAIPNVMGTGEFALAESYLERFPPPERRPVFEVLLSRLDFYRNRIETALERARWAAEEADEELHDASLANRMSLEFMHGNLGVAAELAERLKRESDDELYRQLGDGILYGLAASADGSLDETIRVLERMAELHRARALKHFLGITLNNIVSVKLAQGDAEGATRIADEAREALEATSAGPELAGLLAMRGLALMQLGRQAEAAVSFDEARKTEHLLARAEILVTEADAETWYGSARRAASLLEEAETSCITPELRSQANAAWLSLHVRSGNVEGIADAQRAETRPWSTRPGERSRSLAVAAHAQAILGVPIGPAVKRGLALSHRQGAVFWELYLRTLSGIHGDASRVSEAVAEVASRDSSHLSLLAEAVVGRLPELTPDALRIIELEAASRPERWREALRPALDTGNPDIRLSAGRLLEQVGSPDDVPRLRRLARELKGRFADPSLGRALARQLAPRVFIEDLGAVRIRVGSRTIRGTDIRRKPLALLCFLLTKPGFVATRDQVLDALWPDLEPGDGQNSLNQPLYFLRRVFDPAFDEDVSAPYVRLESDLIWLDEELVDSRSNHCRRLLSQLALTSDLELVVALVREYRGRFAFDFTYEEWSSAYRGVLHSGFLEAVERTVRRLLATGQGEQALQLARTALEIDPEADQVELSLLRIYRSTGAYAAAAEQYGHYAAVLREAFDEEPPPLESLEDMGG